MQDKELYQQVLGLASPWVVGRVELNVEEQRVDVFVEHDSRVKWRCPQCDRELGCHDHTEERTWRHLDTCQFVTQLRARVPRVDCPEHGVVQVLVPWAEPRGRFTMLFERLAIDILKHCQTVKGACEILRISWDQARAVIRSRLEPIKEVAQMIRKRLDNIVNYCRHHITNAVSEGLNSKIMSLKRRAAGYRNLHSFITAIYFHCGGLDMYPRQLV